MSDYDALPIEYVSREEIVQLIHSSFAGLWPHNRITDLDEYLTENGEY